MSHCHIIYEIAQINISVSKFVYLLIFPRADVVLPGALHCPQIYEDMLVDMVSVSNTL